jgi:hypothetical protein
MDSERTAASTVPSRGSRAPTDVGSYNPEVDNLLCRKLRSQVVVGLVRICMMWRRTLSLQSGSTGYWLRGMRMRNTCMRNSRRVNPSCVKTQFMIASVCHGSLTAQPKKLPEALASRATTAAAATSASRPQLGMSGLQRRITQAGTNPKAYGPPRQHKQPSWGRKGWSMHCTTLTETLVLVEKAVSYTST